MPHFHRRRPLCKDECSCVMGCLPQVPERGWAAQGGILADDTVMISLPKAEIV